MIPLTGRSYIFLLRYTFFSFCKNCSHIFFSTCNMCPQTQDCDRCPGRLSDVDRCYAGSAVMSRPPPPLPSPRAPRAFIQAPVAGRKTGRHRDAEYFRKFQKSHGVRTIGKLQWAAAGAPSSMHRTTSYLGIFGSLIVLHASRGQAMCPRPSLSMKPVNFFLHSFLNTPRT